VRVITDENWTELLEGEWMIELWVWAVVPRCGPGAFTRACTPGFTPTFPRQAPHPIPRTAPPVVERASRRPPSPTLGICRPLAPCSFLPREYQVSLKSALEFRL
jgi:hypothetical protein